MYNRWQKLILKVNLNSAYQTTPKRRPQGLHLALLTVIGLPHCPDCRDHAWIIPVFSVFIPIIYSVTTGQIHGPFEFTETESQPKMSFTSCMIQLQADLWTLVVFCVPEINIDKEPVFIISEKSGVSFCLVHNDSVIACRSLPPSSSGSWSAVSFYTL